MSNTQLRENFARSVMSPEDRERFRQKLLEMGKTLAYIMTQG